MGFGVLFYNLLRRGCLNIVGGIQPPLLRGEIPPSPRRRNSRPLLPMIPISPLLCTRPRGDRVGSAEASTPSLISSPVITYGVIHSVCRYLIVFAVVVVIVVIVVVVALEISMIRTS